MTLHLIQKSPFSSSALTDCLNIINQNDIILLMQDGVYSCQSSALKTGNQILALQDDLEARGIEADPTQVEVISYDQFVTLCTQCSNTISWY